MINSALKLNTFLKQTFYSPVANKLTLFGEQSIEFSSLRYRIDITEI